MKSVCSLLGASLTVTTWLLSSTFAADVEGMLGRKFVTTHQSKNLVGPSVQIDEQGRVAATWVEEEKDIRTILFAKIRYSRRPALFPGASQPAFRKPLFSPGGSSLGPSRK